MLPWEHVNLDGSSDLTWRSALAFILLWLLLTSISRILRHSHISMQVLAGTYLCAVAWKMILAYPFAYTWEIRQSSFSFEVTWRTDLILCSLLLLAQGISFLLWALLAGKIARRGSDSAHPHRNI